MVKKRQMIVKVGQRMYNVWNETWHVYCVVNEEING